jgi:sugar phosphate isomerase/epimerase
MDKRKPVARTVDELEAVFDELPDAGFCLDLGHARQVDASMTEAYRMAKTYAAKIRQVHVSEVNARLLSASHPTTIPLRALCASAVSCPQILSASRLSISE